MNGFISRVKADKVTFNIFLFSLAVVFLSLLLTGIDYFNLPPYVPIFNQLPWGNGRLVATPGVFIPTAFFFLIFVLNFIFASFLYTKESPLLARIMGGITFTLSIMNLLFLIKLFILI